MSNGAVEVQVTRRRRSAGPTRTMARACADSRTGSPRSTGGSQWSSAGGPARSWRRGCRAGDHRRGLGAAARGLVRLLDDAGLEVVGAGGRRRRAAARRSTRTSPDVAIVDVRMPPTHTDEGLRAALVIRAELPGHRRARALAVRRGALRRRAARRRAPSGVGYLLKDRVADVAAFLDARAPGGRGRLGARPRGRRAAARPPPPRRPARRAHPARARGARADGRGPLEPGDRRGSSWSPSAPSRST